MKTAQVGYGRGQGRDRSCGWGDRSEQMSAKQATNIHARTNLPEAQKGGTNQTTVSPAMLS